MIAQIDPLYIKTRPMKVLKRLISYAFFEGRPVTTKGRWINPLVFSLLKMFAANNNRYESVEKPIFILGTGRSGTTILGIVLSMHREIGYLNEPKAMWHLIHPHEDIIGNYSQVPDARYRLTAEDATNGMRQRASQMFGAYLTATRSKRLVDKYPSSEWISCVRCFLMHVSSSSSAMDGIHAIRLQHGQNDSVFKSIARNTIGGAWMTESGGFWLSSLLKRILFSLKLLMRLNILIDILIGQPWNG